MDLSEVDKILLENPQEFEDGWKRLSNGIGYVAARTEMPDCTGAMVKRWFEELRTSDQYQLWFPEEHVFFQTKRPQDVRSIVGDTQIIHEKLGGDTVFKLKLKFRDPAEILDVTQFERLGISCAILARGGPQFLPLWTGNVLHLVYDTKNGCVMRSRFWMGDVSPAVPLLSGLIRKDMTSDEALSGLHEHCKTEMANLAKLLPKLYNETKT